MTVAAVAAVDPTAARWCAIDAGVALDAVEVVRRQRQHKSDVLFVSTGGAEVSHVIKLDLGQVRWSPQRELRGLRFAHQATAGETDLTAVQPVGGQVAPPLLVTRFAAGTSVRSVIIEALRGGDLDRARRVSTQIGRWLRCLRQCGRPQSSGVRVAETNASLVQTAARAAALAGRGDIVVKTAHRFELYTDELDGWERELLEVALPSHGDPQPQNFLTDGDLLVAVDLESFEWRRLDIDTARWRFRLELETVRRPGCRDRASMLWRAFRSGHGGSPATCGRVGLLCYVDRLLHRLAWASRPRVDLGRLTPGSVLRRLRERRWRADRHRWLKGLPKRLDDAAQYFEETL